MLCNQYQAELSINTVTGIVHIITLKFQKSNPQSPPNPDYKPLLLDLFCILHFLEKAQSNCGTCCGFHIDMFRQFYCVVFLYTFSHSILSKQKPTDFLPENPLHQPTPSVPFMKISSPESLELIFQIYFYGIMIMYLNQLGVSQC